MKEILYFWIDLLEYVILGMLLVYLLQGMLSERFTGKKKLYAPMLLFFQFVGIRMFIFHCNWMQQLIYGKELYIADSRQSIIPMAVSMVFTLAAGFILYRGSRMRLLSLVTAYFALWELVRFTFYPLAVKAMELTVGHVNHLFWEEQRISQERYQQMIEWFEIAWNLMISAVLITSLVFCVRRYKYYLVSKENSLGTSSEEYDRHWEAALTFVPGLLGLVFAVMLRTILFYYKTEIYSLIENYPELNLMIPILSLLCIVLILLNVKILGEMKKEQELRRQAELYQSRAEELEAHVRDMESVHIQIRGMKHDMKNYIADINALLAQMAIGDVKAKEELRRYVDSMHASLETLELKYQTKNPVTDVIIGRYVRLAQQRKIAFSVDFIYPKHLGIDVFDMSVILNNGLENALEACEQETGELFIGITARQKGNMFLLTIENTFTKILRWKEEVPASSKSQSGHGLGLKNIKNCAEKYYGRADIKTKGDRFYLTVMLQGKTDELI